MEGLYAALSYYIREINVVLDNAVKHCYPIKQQTVEQTFSMVSTSKEEFWGQCSAVSFKSMIPATYTKKRWRRQVNNGERGIKIRKFALPERITFVAQFLG